jgi:tetratricopeptide (TPR) repeat protein
VERAAARAESGDFAGARRRYEEIVAAADTSRKIEALCQLADVELELGEFSIAQARLAELDRLLAQAVAADSVALSRLHAQWLRARLAWETGDFDRGGRLLSEVRESALRFPTADSLRFKSLRIESAIESAEREMDRGEFTAAQRHLDEASAVCKREPELELRAVDVSLAQIILNVARMRPGDGLSLREQVRLANRAAGIVAASESVKRKLAVATLQLKLQRSAEADPFAVARILGMAERFPNPRIVGYVSLLLGDYLMQGRYWRRAARLLRDVFPKPSFLWALSTHLKGVYHLRLGDSATGYACEELAFDVARRMQSPRLRGATLQGLARSAYMLGHRNEAVYYIEAAIPISEQHGSLMSCLKTYQLAARVTRKPKYRRAARRLRLAAIGPASSASF